MNLIDPPSVEYAQPQCYGENQGADPGMQKDSSRLRVFNRNGKVCRRLSSGEGAWGWKSSERES